METSGLLKAMAIAASLALAACGGGSGGSKFGVGDDAGGTGSTGAGDGSGGTGTVEVVQLGNGTGSAFVSGALATSKSTLQSGSSATISLNVVDGSNAGTTTSYAVSVNSNCVGTGLAEISKDGQPVSQVSTSNGLATFTYTPQGCVGTDTITATLSTGTQTHSASVDITVEQDQVLAVEFVSISKKQISLRGIGGQETAQVVFKLVGAQSAPIIGEDVSFELSTSEGGITFAPGTATGTTDSEGLVTTVVQSGTTATTLKVIATHDATQIQGSSSDIVISTGVAVDKNFSLSASDWHPADAATTDGVEVTFSVIAADQFGNSPPDGTQVRFVSPEAGKVDSACELVDGRCSVKWLSSGTRPADNRVQILAYMRGAETFTDMNGNSIYDNPSEFDLALHDLNEPFTDANENDIYDQGEFFVDTNQNQQFDSTGDGEWNGPCLSGVNSAAICSDVDNLFVYRDLRIMMPRNAVVEISRGTFPASVINATSTVTFNGLTFDDGNGNPFPTGTKWEWKLSESDSQTLRLASPQVSSTAETHAISSTSGTISSNQYGEDTKSVSFAIGLQPNPAYGVGTSGELTFTITLPNGDKTVYVWTVNYNKQS